MARDKYVGRIFYRNDSGLTQVPSDIPSDALQVYLDHNSIVDIKTGVFSQLTNCTKLHLYFNTITSIEEDAFLGMIKLSEFFLYQNELSKLEKSMINGLNSLTYLHIGSNEIQTIEAGCFSHLGNLLYLYLGWNKLEVVSANMWLGLHSLKYLHLHNNNIKTLNAKTFDHLASLHRLLLYNNQLTTISYEIFNPVIYPVSNGHPRQIQLGLGAMQCDQQLCWLKQGERLGWITWFVEKGKERYPDCLDNRNTWPDIDLQCPESGKCFSFNKKFHQLVGCTCISFKI